MNAEQEYEFYDSEIDELEADEFESSEEYEYANMESESPFSEEEEMELAMELMSVSSEEELDYFLGNLFKKIGRGVRRIAQPLGRVLKSVAKTALPFVGGALGSFIPVPGVGTAVGSAIGGALSNALEMEMEGMDQEEQEFEMARAFVRLAGAAANQAASAPSGKSLRAVVDAAVKSAARSQIARRSGASFAPYSTSGAPRRSGKWIRRGRKIVLMGV